MQITQEEAVYFVIGYFLTLGVGVVISRRLKKQRDQYQQYWKDAQTDAANNAAQLMTMRRERDETRDQQKYVDEITYGLVRHGKIKVPCRSMTAAMRDDSRECIAIVCDRVKHLTNREALCHWDKSLNEVTFILKD